MMSRLHARGLVLCAAVLFVMAVDAKSADGDVTALLATIKAVGKEGEGNVAAAKAWQKLVEHGPQVLVPVLAGLDGANVRAANWIRLAVDAIAEKALETKQVDAKQLEAFIRDKSHSGRGRRLAFEILRQVDATSPDRLLPDMLDDPSSELRREAIARVITKIEKLLESANKAAALDLLKKIFPHTRDRDQVDLVADHLAKLGVQVDLQKHYGIVNRWYIATPFDNSGQKGFDIAYPPEKRVDLNATYEGKNGTKVQWKMVSTDDPRGPC
ncbi:MAG: hypothetical protein KatS3mg105_3717 [Gemmatales bacterium]|nr:MAG: hypothetical protein KatS3mg105_3717 [Gemmatales bacterium]